MQVAACHHHRHCSHKPRRSCRCRGHGSQRACECEGGCEDVRSHLRRGFATTAWMQEQNENAPARRYAVRPEKTIGARRRTRPRRPTLALCATIQTDNFQRRYSSFVDARRTMFTNSFDSVFRSLCHVRGERQNGLNDVSLRTKHKRQLKIVSVRLRTLREKHLNRQLGCLFLCRWLDSICIRRTPFGEPFRAKNAWKPRQC